MADIVPRPPAEWGGVGGNASAFDDDRWDLLHPLITLGWIVVMEQPLPFTWRGRARLGGRLRALAAVTTSTLISCCLSASLLGVCR